ncbi:MAG: DUF4440 domain-containing protein [Sneathiella sp.]|nr:DUF4440 domain-containing protein [Sneathiella sp.]
MHSSDHLLNQRDFQEIQSLEESLWRSETRFNNRLMDKIFSADFFEFGRSGQRYSRTQMFAENGTLKEITATLPLPEFSARYLSDDIVQVTYISEVIQDGVKLYGNRSAIWSRTRDTWQLRFHQGTPFQK